MKKINQFQKTSGFSLIEVFIVLGLMGILGVASMEMLKQQNNSKVLTESNFEAIDLGSEIRTVLSHPQSCKKTFEGKNLSNGTTVTQIIRSIKDASGTYVDHVYATVNSPVGQRLNLKSLTLVSVDAAKGSAILEVVAEMNNGDSRVYKKSIPLTVLPVPHNPSIIESCVAAGGPPIDPVELCAFTGGTYNTTTHQCQVQVDLDTGILPTYCPPGSQVVFEMVNDRPRIKCHPCTPMEKFNSWQCGKPFSGMNWVNMCYYRTVCQNNQAIELFGAHWDQQVGPTSASGGDTGSKNACKNKRKKCPGEP